MLQGQHHHLPNGSAAVAAAAAASATATATAANGGVKGTAAAEAHANASAAAPLTLRQVCLELQDKVEAFLAEDVDTKLLKGVQAQVKEAVGVIDEALERYRYVGAKPARKIPPLDDLKHQAKLAFPCFVISRIRCSALEDVDMFSFSAAWKSSPSPTTAARTASSSSC